LKCALQSAPSLLINYIGNIGISTTVGLSMTAVFGDLGGYFFGNFSDKATIVIWRYAIHCWPVIDGKVNDLQLP